MTIIMTFLGKDLNKMVKKNEIFFENFLFRFDGCGCDYVKDITHTVPGEQPNITFKCQALSDNKVSFAFAAKKGLVRIAPNGSIEEENILGSLIALPFKDDKDIKKFMRNNGFIFPIGTQSFEKIGRGLLLSIIDRLRLTVELMTAANEIRKD